MLNHDSPLPLYHQLAEILMEQIHSGKYAPGDVIPSEIGMSKQYGIGRPTVRQAMDLLVRKRLVERKRGSGTFVAQKDKQVDLFSLSGTSQAFLTQGIKTAYKTIEKVRLKKITQDKTNAFDGGSAFFLSRLTLIKQDISKPNISKSDIGNEDPVLLEEFFLHPVLFSGLDRVELENRSLSGVVSDHYHLKPETGRQSFKVSILSGYKAELLNLKAGSPILEVERTLNFPRAKGAIFSRLLCKTDNFAFSQTMSLNQHENA